MGLTFQLRFVALVVGGVPQETLARSPDRKPCCSPAGCPECGVSANDLTEGGKPEHVRLASMEGVLVNHFD